MARYEHDFMGTTGDLGGARGMDPNFRGGYRGMRMQGDDRQAAYGWHRWTHEEDFRGSGGFYGRYDRDYGAEGGHGRPGGYEAAWRSGGVRDLRREPRAMREFNANSPALHGGRPEGSRYGRDYGAARYGADYGRREVQRRGPLPGHFQGERFDYANRGMSSGGYSEGWAWGPMRGAR